MKVLSYHTKNIYAMLNEQMNPRIRKRDIELAVAGGTVTLSLTDDDLTKSLELKNLFTS